jgi:hypothetical protein
MVWSRVANRAENEKKQGTLSASDNAKREKLWLTEHFSG